MGINRLALIPFVTAIILAVPLVAMQFSNEVNWDLMDFVIAGLLLIGTGIILDTIVRKVRNRNYRIVYAILVVLLLALVWVELAVGLFDSGL